MAAVLPGWMAGAKLGGDEFHAAVFGPDGRQDLAGHAQAVGRALVAGGADGMANAGRHFASLVHASRLASIGQVMAAAAAQADTPGVRNLIQQATARRQPNVRPAAPATRAAPPVAPALRPALRLALRLAGRGTHPTAHGGPEVATTKASPHGAARMPTPAEQHRQNVEDLSRVIYNEARGHPEAMAAVGWTLRNRMLRNGVADVSKAWGGYDHKAASPTAESDAAALVTARTIADGILSGTIPDPTNGATHYYSPQAMPKEMDKQPSGSIGGGVEDVDGVIDRRTGAHVKNYRPLYSTRFPQRTVPGIADRDYKFYRQPEESSHVR